MSPILTSQGVVLATAMAVSGTVILLAFRLQKSLPHAALFPVSPIPQSQPLPRSCISSEGRKRERKKKRVHFAEDVVDPSGNSEEFRRQRSVNSNSSSGSKSRLKESGKVGGGMPANREALYNGILRDRPVHRRAYSH